MLCLHLLSDRRARYSVWTQTCSDLFAALFRPWLVAEPAFDHQARLVASNHQ